MIYLKTINEALKTINYKDMETWGSKEKPKKLDPPIDKNYFDMVFADFIDNGSISSLDGGSYYLRNIKYNMRDIYDLSETFAELQSCLDKIKIEYPDIEHTFNYFDDYRIASYIELFYRYDYRYGE